MKIFTKKDKSPIDKEIENVLGIMALISPDSEQYSAMVANIEVLIKAKSCNKDQTKVSPDTIALIVGNLLGIGLILGYEQAHIITTKALGFIIKGRV